MEQSFLPECKEQKWKENHQILNILNNGGVEGAGICDI